MLEKKKKEREEGEGKERKKGFKNDQKRAVIGVNGCGVENWSGYSRL